MLKSAFLSALTISLFLSACAVNSTEQASGDMVSVWSVDRTGAPPFNRSLVLVPAADIARLELEDGVVETTQVRVVDFRGKPPFRRTIKEVPVIDAARLEVESIEPRAAKPRPFMKRHW